MGKERERENKKRGEGGLGLTDKSRDAGEWEEDTWQDQRE